MGAALDDAGIVAHQSARLGHDRCGHVAIVGTTPRFFAHYGVGIHIASESADNQVVAGRTCSGHGQVGIVGDPAERDSQAIAEDASDAHLSTAVPIKGYLAPFASEGEFGNGNATGISD